MTTLMKHHDTRTLPWTVPGTSSWTPTTAPTFPPFKSWRTAQVPLPWQAQFDDLRLVSGTAWYRRHFT